MSLDITTRTPDLAVGRPALARCVAADLTDFAERVWGRAPLLSQAGDLPEPFTDLLSAAAVDELVSTRGLRTPFLRVARAGSTLPSRDFTAPAGVGAGSRGSCAGWAGEWACARERGASGWLAAQRGGTVEG